MCAHPSDAQESKDEWEVKLEALKEAMASLDVDRRASVLDDAIARAREASRMARLEQIVQELNRKLG